MPVSLLPVSLLPVSPLPVSPLPVSPLPDEALPLGPPQAIAPEKAEANFKRWFDSSQVVDAEGRPLIVYHATRRRFDVFQPQRDNAGFHFGNLDQATMRGYGGANILEVYLSARNMKRLRDHGTWTREQIRRAKAAGHDGIVYLNRYEGMTTERIMALEASGLLRKLDKMSDKEFKKAIPEAQDSYIVFEPTQIKSARNPGTWSRTDPRMDDGGDFSIRRREQAGASGPEQERQP